MRHATLLGTLAIALALALPAVAAETPAATPAIQEEMGGAGGAMHRDMRGMGERRRGHFRHHHRAGQRPLISLALSHRQELGLSSAQIQTLEQIRDTFRREAIKRGADIRVAELDLATLTRTDPSDAGKPVDMAQVEAKVRDIERLRTEQRLARIRAIEQGKAQLTPEQRAKLASLLTEVGPHWRRSATPAAIPRTF
ncbi:MAG TPA: Spy/CpxP family protein refolding chaperone [Methylomirabilota bacterium]|nr:Spy/CpxP family protein refolding chaperone [Methylomirabilota bacterium]